MTRFSCASACVDIVRQVDFVEGEISFMPSRRLFTRVPPCRSQHDATKREAASVAEGTSNTREGLCFRHKNQNSTYSTADYRFNTEKICSLAARTYSSHQRVKLLTMDWWTVALATLLFIVLSPGLLLQVRPMSFFQSLQRIYFCLAFLTSVSRSSAIVHS